MPPKHHAVLIKTGKTDQATHHVDGRDTMDWQIDSIGKGNHLHAKSNAPGFDVSGKKDDKTLSCTLTYSGTPPFTVDYQLFEEGNGGSTQILGPNDERLQLVIDTIGGMMPKPPDDDGPDERDHRHGRYGSRQG
jgi:hypothetical protein